MSKRVSFFIFLSFLLCSPLLFAKNQDRSLEGSKSLLVTSKAFKDGESIPEKYTCDGKNISPSFRWTKGPRGTESYVLIATDQDASKQVKAHWVLYDIPPTINYLPKGFPPIRLLANAEKHGFNDFGKIGYEGPCLSEGESHRYEFRIYALDIMLMQDAGLKKSELLKLMEGHTLASGTLTGTYEKKGSEE